MDEDTRAKLASEYPHFNKAQWDLISGEAYDRGHAYGQSEVNLYARDIAYFVNKILEAGLTPES